MNKLKVIIADDYTLLREAWRTLLQNQSNIEVVACVGNGQQVIDAIKIKQAELVLMDINMPVLDGIAATEIISNTTPWVKVLALSMHTESGYIKKMFQAGAKGFLSKTASQEELFQAIATVQKGEVYISPICANKLMEEDILKVDKTPDLTERELQVIKLIVNGNTAREIAQKLFISPKTVDAHKNHIFSKLNIHNVASLTKLAIQKGIVF